MKFNTTAESDQHSEKIKLKHDFYCFLFLIQFSKLYIQIHKKVFEYEID
jgi:hypothetical protein